MDWELLLLDLSFWLRSADCRYLSLCSPDAHTFSWCRTIFSSFLTIPHVTRVTKCGFSFMICSGLWESALSQNLAYIPKLATLPSTLWTPSPIWWFHHWLFAPLLSVAFPVISAQYSLIFSGPIAISHCQTRNYTLSSPFVYYSPLFLQNTTSNALS